MSRCEWPARIRVARADCRRETSRRDGPDELNRLAVPGDDERLGLTLAEMTSECALEKFRDRLGRGWRDRACARGALWGMLGVKVHLHDQGYGLGTNSVKGKAPGPYSFARSLDYVLVI